MHRSSYPGGKNQNLRLTHKPVGSAFKAAQYFKLDVSAVHLQGDVRRVSLGDAFAFGFKEGAHAWKTALVCFKG